MKSNYSDASLLKIIKKVKLPINIAYIYAILNIKISVNYTDM